MGEITPLPCKPLLALLLLLFSDSFAFTNLFSYVTFMVRDFGVAPQDVGYYSGYLASSHYLSQFCTCFLWGYLSDRYGRKPFLLLGIVGTLTCSVCLGLSTTFWQALLSRILGGLFNSNLPLSKSYLGDICDASNRASALSQTTLMFGLGQLIGPFYAGLVSQLAVKHPSVFEGTLFDTFPYLVPCFTASLLSLASLGVAFAFLPESKITLKSVASSSNTCSNSSSNPCSNTHVSIEQQHLMIDQKYQEQEEELGFDQEHVLNDLLTIDDAQEVSFDPEQDASQHQHQHSASGAKPAAAESGDKVYTFTVVCAMVLFSLAATVNIGFTEIYPAWAMLSPELHGIGFTTSDIGITWGVAGGTMIVLQLFFFAPMANRWGAARLIRMGFVPASIVVCFPLLSYVSHRSLLWMLVCLFFAIRSAGIVLIMPSLNLLVNLASPPQHIGQVNGMNSTIAALSRGLGPFILTTIFAWSLGEGHSFPFNFWFGFFLVEFLLLALLIISLFIPNLGVLKSSSSSA